MLTTLPHWNAFLNFTAIILALTGYFAARSGRPERHRRFMALAIITVMLFLISYLVYHAQYGITPFPDQGGVRTVYYAILIVHALSALVTGFLLPVTLFYALRHQEMLHKKMARYTLTAWIFASLTGLIVYFMVYHWPS